MPLKPSGQYFIKMLIFEEDNIGSKYGFGSLVYRNQNPGSTDFYSGRPKKDTHSLK
jgi:hypothetical protein